MYDIHCLLSCYNLQVSRALETFDVEETATSHLTCMCPNVHIINATLMTFDPEKHVSLYN